MAATQFRGFGLQRRIPPVDFLRFPVQEIRRKAGAEGSFMVSGAALVLWVGDLGASDHRAIRIGLYLVGR